MTRLYENQGIWKRGIAMIVVVIGAILWGLWEMWSASRAGADATNGAMFGILFIGGGFYGLYQLANDWREVVARLERDEATGELTATVWRPQGPLQLTGALTNWRYHVKVASRTSRLPFILADHPALSRPLRFEMKPSFDLTGLRQVAPEAVGEYEASIGKTAS